MGARHDVGASAATVELSPIPSGPRCRRRSTAALTRRISADVSILSIRRVSAPARRTRMRCCRRIQGLSTSVTDSGQRTYDAGMTGSLFELPGGKRRARRLVARPDTSGARVTPITTPTSSDYGLTIGNTDYIAERDVYGGYLELRWPFYKGIELQTAGRVGLLHGHQEVGCESDRGHHAQPRRDRRPRQYAARAPAPSDPRPRIYGLSCAGDRRRQPQLGGDPDADADRHGTSQLLSRSGRMAIPTSTTSERWR